MESRVLLSREGCVIRVEKSVNNITHFLKIKPVEYYQLEDAFKSDKTSIDIEEIQ